MRTKEEKLTETVITGISESKIQKEGGRGSKERNHLTKPFRNTCNWKQPKTLVQQQLYSDLPLSF